MRGEKGIMDTAKLINFLTSDFNGILNSPSNHSTDNFNKAGTYLTKGPFKQLRLICQQINEMLIRYSVAFFECYITTLEIVKPPGASLSLTSFVRARSNKFQQSKIQLLSFRFLSVAPAKCALAFNGALLDT